MVARGFAEETLFPWLARTFSLEWGNLEIGKFF